MLTYILPGDRSRAVRKLQVALKIPVTMVFDKVTELNVRDYQKKNGLVSDGVVGPMTIAKLGLDLSPTPLDEQDYLAAAKELGVSVAHIRAVAEVEAVGNAFGTNGYPTCLFERHYFYKQLTVIRKSGQSLTDLIKRRDHLAASYPDICNPKRGGYKGKNAEWDRLMRAVTLDKEAGYESASYGLFQIMGAHWKLLEFTSASSFVRALQASEGDHLNAFIGFIKANPQLHKALREEKWDVFARGYNGPAYKDNQYDVKMANAFAKWKKELNQ